MSAATCAAVKKRRVPHLTYYYFPERQWPRKPEPKRPAIDKRPADPREALVREAGQRGLGLAELSRMLRRHSDYLGHYIREGCPRCLSEHDHRLLADVMGLDERGLGVRTLWVPGAI
jgi:hypothetical protein